MRRLLSLRALLAALAIVSMPFDPPAVAGPINPDISLIGQPRLTWTDETDHPNRERAAFDIGETEIVFDAYLNPYARGMATLALGEEGLELEEGTFTVLRGLPAGLQLKGGKYRVGFGRLNAAHPHTYPFAERFRVLASCLPGEEAFNETGISLSELVPLFGDAPLTAAIDLLQGDTFRREREPIDDPLDPHHGETGDRAEETRPAFVGRLSLFAPLGAGSGLDLGVSAAEGTNNVAAGSRTRLLGIDAKAKLWRSSDAYLLLQGEWLRAERGEAAWSLERGYAQTTRRASGGYLFADYNFGRRYNAGFSFERFEPLGEPDSDAVEEVEARAGAAGGDGSGWDQAWGAFAGYALMEESLALRLSWELFQPSQGEEAQAVALRVIYSMGPHKAHAF